MPLYTGLKAQIQVGLGSSDREKGGHIDVEFNMKDSNKNEIARDEFIRHANAYVEKIEAADSKGANAENQATTKVVKKLSQNEGRSGSFSNSTAVS